jgi:serine/threonine protein phosphatase PrpC
MNKKLLFFLCTIISLCYAAESPYPHDRYSNIVNVLSVQNKLPYQEDRVVWSYIDHKRGHLFGVIDGHCGFKTADYVVNNFPKKFKQYLDQAFTVKKSFEHAFLDIEEHVVNTFTSGSTAVFVYMSNGIAHVANVGDSRAVFGSQNAITFATCDQTPDREDERARILQAGGVIFRYKRPGQELEPWRINGLAMSRSLGDAWAKGRADEPGYTAGIRKVLIDGDQAELFSAQLPDMCLKDLPLYTPQVGQVIAEPEHTERTLTDIDRWLIIASDGLWDVVGSKDALTMVQDYYDAEGCLEGIARFLCECAIAKGSDDNITIMVVDLLNDWFKKEI